MTERDLSRVLTQSVQDVHLSDEARRSIRLAAKEERPVRIKKSLVIALIFVLTLTASVGIAEELGLFDFLARMAGQSVLPGANDLVQTGVAYAETDDVTYTVKQAVYDGKSVSLLVEMRSKDDKTFLMGRGWSPDRELVWYASAIEGVDQNDTRTLGEYAREMGYTRFVEATIENGDTYHCIEEWNNNVLTLLCTFDAEGDEVVLDIEYSSSDYMVNSQRIPDQITLTACEPLWTVASTESFDAPEFGIRIDGVTITCTPLQSYFYIDYTVISHQQHNSFGWNATLVDMDKEHLPVGVLGLGSSNGEGTTGMHMARWGNQSMTWHGTFGAMEQPPEQLMILLRNWDDFEKNEYFPITLK